jgi:uncharacterized protein
MLNQALALAEALGVNAQVRRIARSALLDALPDVLFASRPVLALHQLGPPWPTLIIGSGRYGGRLSAAIKRVHPATRNVQIQDPRAARGYFDLIITPAHDRSPGRNVIHTTGSLHALAPRRVAADGNAWRQRLAGEGQLLAVLIGGPTRQVRLGAMDLEDLCIDLARLVDQGGWRIAVCVSRRTPADWRSLLTRLLGKRATLLWLGEGDNPYRGMLALADAFVIGADSVNMTTEALATGRPVHRWGEARTGSRLAQFHEVLEERGMVRAWRSVPEHWEYMPLDELPEVARVVTERLGLVPAGAASSAS